ncbi:MAG: hypothetical protein FWC97_05125 [Treponema sp.]|nr:hypothetical protein [Treponema sp.]
MNKRKKKSFAKSFTALSLILILFVKLVLSVIFFFHLRSVITDLTAFNTKEMAAHSRNMIVANIREHENALKHTAVGVTHFLRQNAASAPWLISGYLGDVMRGMPNVLDIYFTGNSVWNNPGGFAAFGSGRLPYDDWDNTRRPWFASAKYAQGSVAFSLPYVDVYTGNIVITLSMTVYDAHNDIGVIAMDVTVNVLHDIINAMRNFPLQEVYIINSNGKFITHENIYAIMNHDFFDEKNMEKHRVSVLEHYNFFSTDQNYFIYSSKIPYSDWVLVTIIPTAVIFSQINIFITSLIFFSVLMFLFAAFVTIVFTYKKFTIPMKNMIKMANALAANDYNVDVNKFNNDEIGDLQHSLLKIREKLKTNIDSLQNHLDKKENNDK